MYIQDFTFEVFNQKCESREPLPATHEYQQEWHGAGQGKIVQYRQQPLVQLQVKYKGHQSPHEAPNHEEKQAIQHLHQASLAKP